MKNRCLGMILILTLLLGLFTGCAAGGDKTAETPDADVSDRIKIGILMWDRSDVFGSRCREMIDETAAALDIDVCYYDHHNDTALEIEGFKELAAEGCKGVIICNTSDVVMSEIIDLANEDHIYVAQFLRKINKGAYPEIYDKAVESAYFIGSVHENEIECGSMMTKMALDAGDRHIAVVSWGEDDNSWIWRREGIAREVEIWNAANPYEKVEFYEPQYSGITAEGGKNACRSIIDECKDVDAIIVAGGGGEPLLGVLGEISRAHAEEEIGKVDVVSTDFLDDLGERIDDGSMLGEAGGQAADPMFALIMVYNTITRAPSYVGVPQYYKDVKLPYIFITSSDEYDDYYRHFVDEFPYTQEEMIEIAEMDYKDLIKKASKHSLDDTVKRADR